MFLEYIQMRLLTFLGLDFEELLVMYTALDFFAHG